MKCNFKEIEVVIQVLSDSNALRSRGKSQSPGTAVALCPLRPKLETGLSLSSMLLLATLWIGLLSACFRVSAADPEVTISYFKHLPAKLAFFEDTTVCARHPQSRPSLTEYQQSILYHDPVEKSVYFSDDEGKKWTRADIPTKVQVIQVIEHPFDNSYVWRIPASSIIY